MNLFERGALTTCSICGSFNPVKSKSNKIAGNISLFVGKECRVCHYREVKQRFKRQLLLDLDNKVYVNGKWVRSSESSRIFDRLEYTIYHLFEALGDTVAKEVLHSTLKFYWYKNFFTLMQNPRLMVSSQ